ncbi:MAG: hypothetical protein AAGM22_11310 [Acidobacteriota bacterium]
MGRTEADGRTRWTVVPWKLALAGAVTVALFVGCGDAPASSDEPVDAPGASNPSAASDPAPQASTASRSGAPPRAGDPRPGTLARRPFWHDGELVNLLGLEDAELSVMETRRQAAIDAARRDRQATTARRGELSTALGDGRWPDARRLVVELGTDASSTIEADVELKISILELLSPEQRQTLLRERPNALRRSWLLPSGRRPASGPNPLLDRAASPASAPSADE